MNKDFAEYREAVNAVTVSFRQLSQTALLIRDELAEQGRSDLEGMVTDIQVRHCNCSTQSPLRHWIMACRTIQLF